MAVVNSITPARLTSHLPPLPTAWLELLANDPPPRVGDVYATRGACIDPVEMVHDVNEVWHVSRVIRGVADFERWTADDGACARASPRRRVKKGAGPAGEPAPVHPCTSRQVVCYTDGGCVENAHVNDADQLAGAGAVVLNDDRTTARVELYTPVITDPRHRCYLGATRGTNNTGELVGIGEALLWIRDYEGSTDDVVVYVDSKYAAAMVEARWSFSSNVLLI